MSGKIPPADIDERARRTRNALAGALMELSREKPVDAIRVRELSLRAGIGRTTFYQQFSSLPDFLRKSYAGMLLRAAELAQAQDGATAILATRLILDHLARSGGYGEVIRASREWPGMLAAGEARLRGVAENNLRQLHPAVPEARRRAAAIFITGGFFALAEQWTESGRRATPGDIQSTFEQFATAVVATVQPLPSNSDDSARGACAEQ